VEALRWAYHPIFPTGAARSATGFGTPAGGLGRLFRLVPRNRNVRVAVLGSSVQRAAATGYSSTRSSPLRRRFVVVGLIVVSLVLITISFRSNTLDSAQGVGASALRPLEIGANRVARPFRDAAGWTRGLFHAKAQNARLRREVDQLRQQVSREQVALNENAILRKLLRYEDSPSFPRDFRPVAARVLTNPPATFTQTITVAAGSNQGVGVQDVVVTQDGLVGQVTRVSSDVSKVMLITDPESAVSAVDANHLGAIGLLEHGSASNSVALDRVGKDKFVAAGDTIITAGSPGNGQLPSIYPRGILIGTVTSVGQNDTDLFKEIQVQPFVNLGSLQAVLVLVPKSTTTAKPGR
jgi:rod shape-determining protein MreC